MMKQYDVTIQLMSPLQLSGGQADVNVDIDMLVDSMGIPYIPAKRFRGVIYESALEVVEMVEGLQDGHEYPYVNKTVLDELFNRGHKESQVVLEIGDFHIAGYEALKNELELLHTAYPSVVTKKSIRNAFTSLRYETAIDENSGVVKEGSLRNLRVMDKEEQIFTGQISMYNGTEAHEHLLAVALQNAKNIGYKRNRGLGRIQCTMDAQLELVKQALNKK